MGSVIAKPFKSTNVWNHFAWPCILITTKWLSYSSIERLLPDPWLRAWSEGYSLKTLQYAIHVLTVPVESYSKIDCLYKSHDLVVGPTHHARIEIQAWIQFNQRLFRDVQTIRNFLQTAILFHRNSPTTVLETKHFSWNQTFLFQERCVSELALVELQRTYWRISFPLAGNDRFGHWGRAITFIIEVKRYDKYSANAYWRVCCFH